MKTEMRQDIWRGKCFRDGKMKEWLKKLKDFPPLLLTFYIKFPFKYSPSCDRTFNLIRYKFCRQVSVSRLIMVIIKMIRNKNNNSIWMGWRIESCTRFIFQHLVSEWIILSFNDPHFRHHFLSSHKTYIFPLFIINPKKWESQWNVNEKKCIFSWEKL